MNSSPGLGDSRFEEIEIGAVPLEGAREAPGDPKRSDPEPSDYTNRH
jgi:hypothetical protein